MRVVASRARVAAGLGTTLVLAACTDGAPSAPLDPKLATPTAALSAEGATPAERAAAAQLARAVALSLRDGGLRGILLADMRSRGVTSEKKLQFSTYAQGPGNALIVHMAKASRLSTDSIAALMRVVRPLELYMPVREHRKEWQGEEVIVATQLAESDPIVAYRSDGSPVQLTTEMAPTTPTLALVPVETDFSRAASLQASAYESCTDTMFYCDGGPVSGPPPGPGIVPASAPTGQYMTYSSLFDHGEHWLKGDPEIEVHVVGPGPNDAPNFGRSITCASESGAGYRWFDQNTTSWTGGYVQLLSATDFSVNRFVDTLPDNRSYFVVLYEDDDGRCVIRDDPWRILNQLAWLATWAYVGHLNMLACKKATPNSDASWACSLGIVGSAIAFAMNAWSLFQTNDDYLGLAFTRDRFPEYQNSSASHVLIKDPNTVQNGGIKLVYHRYGTATGP
jgi:hypothetical protein